MTVRTYSYFKYMSQDTGIPYQTLINLYLQDCVNSHGKLDMQWAWLILARRLKQYYS